MYISIYIAFCIRGIADTPTRNFETEKTYQEDVFCSECLHGTLFSDVALAIERSLVPTPSHPSLAPQPTPVQQYLTQNRPNPPQPQEQADQPHDDTGQGNNNLDNLIYHLSTLQVLYSDLNLPPPALLLQCPTLCLTLLNSVRLIWYA